jgi:hypothetical protein
MKSTALTSRRFLTAMVDAVISLGLLVCGHFWPDQLDFIKAVLVTMQPLFIALIAAYTVEDSIIAHKALPK